MEVSAFVKSVKISPRKVRLVADAVRKLSINKALDALYLTPKRASLPIKKVLESAIANAVNNGKLNKDILYIKKIEVSEGPAYKRFHPSTRGRIHPYKKRTSHIRVVLEEAQKRQEGTETSSVRKVEKVDKMIIKKGERHE